MRQGLSSTAMFLLLFGSFSSSLFLQPGSLFGSFNLVTGNLSVLLSLKIFPPFLIVFPDSDFFLAEI